MRIHRLHRPAKCPVIRPKAVDCHAARVVISDEKVGARYVGAQMNGASRQGKRLSERTERARRGVDMECANAMMVGARPITPGYVEIVS